MTLSTATTPTIAQPTPFAVIAKKHRDGSVLLSAADDRVFKLNGVGALTWTVLEQSATPLTLNEIVQRLHAEFENVNTGGELQYEVTQERLKIDTSRFIKSLADAGLIRVVRDARGGETYRIEKEISSTTATTVAELSGTAPATDVSSFVSIVTSGLDTSHVRPTRFEVLTALFGLIAFDLLLRCRGFEALIKKVECQPTAEPQKTDVEVCRRVCAMVNRAQVYYPKKAMCLQHSAVVTCLLRRKGVPAQMVLAAQEFPAKGHAWVEVEGAVVNDFRQVKTRYRELRRI